MSIGLLRKLIRNCLKILDFHSSTSDFSLDIGCGFSSEVADQYFAKYKLSTRGTVSCDIGHSEIKVSNFVQCDGQNLPFKDCMFDSVFLMQVIEHVPRPQDLLQEIKRVLKRGGVLMLTTPNFYSMDSYRDPNHLWHFTPENLRLILKGFNYVSITGHSGPWALYNVSANITAATLRSLVFNSTRLLSIICVHFPFLSASLAASCIKDF